MKIRKAEKNDFPRLLELSRNFKTSPFSFDTKIYDQKNYYPFFAEKIINSSENYVCVKDNDIIGFVSYKINNSISKCLNKKIGSILLLSVDEKYQGRGIGKLLIEKAKNDLISEGVEIITVGTDLYNISALNAYTACGFNIISSWYIYRYYADGGKPKKEKSHIILRQTNTINYDELNRINRPLSIMKENINQNSLLEFQKENIIKKLHEKEIFLYEFYLESKKIGYIIINRDYIAEKTINNNYIIYRVSDVVSLEDKDKYKNYIFMLNSLKHHIDNYNYLEIWVDSIDTILIEALEVADFHLKYVGISLHYKIK